MGMVLLDMTFRVERKFHIRIPKNWHEQLGLSWRDGNTDVTLRQYHEYILKLCDQQGALAPAESWSMIVKAVEDASGLDRSKITADTMLIRDIGPTG
jgi:hypothetical protein